MMSSLPTTHVAKHAHHSTGGALLLDAHSQAFCLSWRAHRAGVWLRVAVAHATTAHAELAENGVVHRLS